MSEQANQTGVVSSASQLTLSTIEAMAREQGLSTLECISRLQAGAALLPDDEATLDALCAIKSELLAVLS